MAVSPIENTHRAAYLLLDMIVVQPEDERPESAAPLHRLYDELGEIPAMSIAGAAYFLLTALINAKGEPVDPLCTVSLLRTTVDEDLADACRRTREG